MNFRLVASAGCLLLMAVSAHAADPKATTLLHKALEAQGGEQKLRALKNVQWEATGYRNQLEESERPTGPYIPEFQTITETHDYQGTRYRSTKDLAVYPAFKWATGEVVADGIAIRIAGGRTAAGAPQQVQLAQEKMALSPERILLTALDAADVHLEADVVLQSVPQNVVAFALDGAPVKIYLNAYTHLPTAVDYSGPLARSGYWAFLGDHTMRTYYGFWWLAKGGIHLPMQWNVEGDGMPEQTFAIRKLLIDAELKDSDFAIPEDARKQFNPNAKAASVEDYPLGNPRSPAVAPAPGIVLIPGAWNATIVRQDDGLVILEAPISSGYSAKVIAETETRFPGQRVKAVITTSDSWPHLSGIREFVAKGVPIYALDLNQPILERVIAMPHTTTPDALQRTPRKAEFHWVHDKVTLGSGPNRMEIYPIRGETSERQMMVYFPEHHLLYGSDPFQRSQDGAFTFPQAVSELTDAVAREHLVVDRFFMMHVEVTQWSEVAKSLAAAAERNTPDGVL